MTLYEKDGYCFSVAQLCLWYFLSRDGILLTLNDFFYNVKSKLTSMSAIRDNLDPGPCFIFL